MKLKNAQRRPGGFEYHAIIIWQEKPIFNFYFIIIVPRKLEKDCELLSNACSYEMLSSATINQAWFICLEKYVPYMPTNRTVLYNVAAHIYHKAWNTI